MPKPPTLTATAPSPAPRGQKRVRFDRGSGKGSDLAPGRGSLLRAFAAWGGCTKAPDAAPVEERRSEPRHQTVECLAWVGWRSWRKFHLNDALVINLSRGGAQVFVDTPPPAGRELWVYLETPREKAVVRARTLGVRTTPCGQCVARVAFLEPCPLAFFEAAVCGLAASNPKARVPSSPRRAAAGARRATV